MRRFLVNKRARAPAWRRRSAARTGYCLRVAADVPDGKEGNQGQHGMSQRRQTLAIGLRRAWLARCMAGGAVLGAGNAAAQIPPRPSAAEACLAAKQSLSLGSALPRTTARLDGEGTVRIVTIGSSSTTGLWMASRAATYPEVMRRELARLRPSARIEVVNSGRIGETIGGGHPPFRGRCPSSGPPPRLLASRPQR